MPQYRRGTAAATGVASAGRPQALAGDATGPSSLAFGHGSTGGPGDFAALNALLSEQVRLFEAALANMHQGLCMFDAQSRLVVSNRRYHDIFNIPDDAIARGMTQHDICERLIDQGCYPPTVTLAAIEADTHRALEADDGRPILREMADGRTLSVLYRVMAGGGWVSTFEDVTDRRNSEARIDHLARHDALTDLANTRDLRRRYRDLVTGEPPAAPLLAMFYVDLDRFKFVNDTYGHAAGDGLLRAVADRLRANTHPDDLVARLGGDEFALLLGVPDEGAAAAAGQRLVEALSRPYELAGGRFDVGASVGVAVRVAGDGDLDPLLHDADLALQHAKAEGRGTVVVFEPGMTVAARTRATLEAELRNALAEDQFEVFYQTLVDARAQAIIGVEALARWRHPRRGLLSPAAFIDVMEQTGLIVGLGRWVLERACRDAAGWPDGITVAVNVSSVQLRQRAFGETVLDVLERTGLPAGRLEIEITESSLLEESEVTHHNLALIHEAGIRISMDDFGTGYSSLSYLRRFPIDKVKIDRSFMKDAETHADARAIIRAVAALGTSLGMTTLVEGVETQRQYELARAEGVDQVQGYLFSQPQPVAVVSRLLAQPSVPRRPDDDAPERATGTLPPGKRPEGRPVRALGAVR